MQEITMTEISVENVTCVFTCIYRSLSQNHGEIKTLYSELNILLTNINNYQLACSILIVGFNAKCSKRCISDKNRFLRLTILKQRRARIKC